MTLLVNDIELLGIYEKHFQKDSSQLGKIVTTTTWYVFYSVEMLCHRKIVYPFQLFYNFKLRQVLFIVRAGVVKTLKVQKFTLYQNETSNTTLSSRLILSDHSDLSQ